MRTGIIYRYLNIESGKSYVGQTLNPKDRFRQHNNSNKKDWHVDYHKNPEKYEYMIIEDNIPEDKLDDREIYWISYFDSFRNGYNLTPGGGGARGCVPWNKGKVGCYSEDHKRKISESKKGENNPNYGKHHSEETKRKISESNKGKPKKKCRKPIIQYSKSGEFIKEWSSVTEAVEYFNFKSIGNISQCLTGNRNSAYGYMWKYK